MNTIQITRGIAMDYEAFINESIKHTNAKGIWSSVEENLKDYFKLTKDSRGYDYIKCGSTIYENLEELKESLGCNPMYHKRTQRNMITKNLAIKIIENAIPY